MPRLVKIINLETHPSRHKKTLRTLNINEYTKTGKCKVLLDQISVLQKESEGLEINIDLILLKIANARSDYSEYPELLKSFPVDALSSLSVEDYRIWMKKKSKGDLSYKINYGLFAFKDVQPSNTNKEKYDKIVNNGTEALKKIADEDEFNKVRIKSIYRIDP